MKKIDVRFLLMGIFLLLYGFVRRSPFIIVAGGAFLIYSFFSKSMVEPKKNFFKPELRLKSKKVKETRSDKKGRKK